MLRPRSRALIALVLLAVACDDASSKPRSDAEPAGEPAAETAHPVAEPANIVRRPDGTADLVLTEERRRRIEARFSQAKDFLDAGELELKLFELELLRGKNKIAIRKFDSWAKNKWVLFTGHIAKVTPNSFQLAVRYTPRDADDPMGLTSNWFFVTFRDIEYYAHDKYRPGEPAAVVAQYQGKARAGPGFDLVLSGVWMQPLSEE